jgi:hypothetical protein
MELRKARIFAFLSLLPLGALTLGIIVYCHQTPRPGRQLGMWETSSNGLRIRIVQYDEEGALLAGTYYLFESAKPGTNEWQQIVMFRHDDRPPIPRDQVRFVGDDVAFVFMGWVYAVSTDRGASWSVYDATRNLPGWRCCNYGLIKNVDLWPDGTGVMTLKPILGRTGEVSELRTRDYGVHWY